MTIFAIELSSPQGSIALVKNGEVICEKQWIENFKNRQQLFDGISELKKENALDWKDVEVYAYGRGPGAFSGMRIALSVINALAQPDQKPIYALSSGHALATQICQQTNEQKIAVIGDARRKKLWIGEFESGELQKEYKLIDIDELHSTITPDTLVVSPDHDRLTELLETCKQPTNPKSVYPQASTLGTLVEKRLEANIPSEEIEPLYMHPPVFIKPRFPA